MATELQSILSSSISDVGNWRWWTSDTDLFQLEFGGVQLFDESQPETKPRSSILALQFSGQASLVFLDDLKRPGIKNPWYQKLHADQIEPFSVEHDEFIFDDIKYAKKVFKSYPHKNFQGVGTTLTQVLQAKNLLCLKCGAVGVIVSGEVFKVRGYQGWLSEKDILKKHSKWWKYWKEYWKFKDTEKAYPNDFACEVTIPING